MDSGSCLSVTVLFKKYFRRGTIMVVVFTIDCVQGEGPFLMLVELLAQPYCLYDLCM